MANKKKSAPETVPATPPETSSATVGKLPVCARIRAKFADPAFRKKCSKGAAIAVLSALVAAGGVFGWMKYVEMYAVPQVMGANFSLEYRKVPFDVPSIDFTFSTDIDPATVNAASVTVSSGLSGYPSLKSGNVVSIALQQKMTVGEKYVFTLSKDIATPRGKKL